MMTAIMPSSTVPSLALVIPGFAQAFGGGWRSPSLDQLLAYSDNGVQATDSFPSHAAWQTELLRLLQLDATYASAPLSWLGAGGFEAGTWLHVQPVSLAISARGLTLQSTSEWTTDTRRIAATVLSKHLSESGFDWRDSGSEVYLRCEKPLNVETAAPATALRQSLQDAMPTGSDAVALRRLMTELQMLLHNREDLNFNAVWLWGSGSMRQRSVNLPMLAANDAFARGVYAASQCPDRCSPNAANVEQVLESEASIAVARAPIEQLESEWLAPLLSALQRGTVHRVGLYLDGFAIHLKYSLFRRLFGRARAAELSA
jgi:hypothetical protein